MSPEIRYQLNVDQIQRFLPHRAPFLLVDRILDIVPKGDLHDLTGSDAKVGTKVKAIKNVSFNESYLWGHFPGLAIVPGVMIVETMAQVASFSVYPYMRHDLERLAKSFTCILVGVNQGRFRRPVTPGDTMLVETEVIKCRGKLWVFSCEATVEGKRVAEAEIMANLVPASEAAASVAIGTQ